MDQLQHKAREIRERLDRDEVWRDITSGRLPHWVWNAIVSASALVPEDEDVWIVEGSKTEDGVTFVVVTELRVVTVTANGGGKGVLDDAAVSLDVISFGISRLAEVGAVVRAKEVPIMGQRDSLVDGVSLTTVGGQSLRLPLGGNTFPEREHYERLLLTLRSRLV